MSRVSGDSTPFPHDFDYIHMLRDGIECAVRLLSAQHSIRAALERAQATERAQENELKELNALFERVQAAAAPSISEGLDRTVRTAAQIVAGARGILDAAGADLASQVSAEVGQARHIVDKARDTTQSAMEHFLERHTPPGSRCALQLVAGAESNTGQVSISTPYGVVATFGAAMPSGHAWARPRRVSDFVAQLEIQMPKESGWLSKRVEMTPVRLDRMFISELVHGGSFGVLNLRKGAGSGSGYALRVELTDNVGASIRPLRDDGTPAEAQPLVLEGKDLAMMVGLWRSAADSSRDLFNARRRLISASFVERPLLELDSPSLLAEALIGDMAPLAVEISRRSGAPGELVLRRNLGEGKREETYCTHAELLDKIRVLPPDLRRAFAGLHLTESGMAAQLLHSGAPPMAAPESPRLSGVPGLTQPFTGSRPPAMAGQPSRPPSIPPPQGTPAEV
jgi:hypothetical protein